MADFIILQYFDSFGNDFSLRNFMTVKGWQLKDGKTLIYCATNELNLCDAVRLHLLHRKTCCNYFTKINVDCNGCELNIISV